MPDDDDVSSIRGVRIAAVVGGVVLIIGLAFAVGTAGGNQPTPTPSTATPAAAAPPSSPPAAVSSPPTATAPTPTRPVVRWRGRLTVSGPSAERDLDFVPPRTNEADDDLTGDFATTDLYAESGAQVARLTSGTPGFARCRDVGLADGTEEIERVQEGDVLCVITSQGRVALLKATYASSLDGLRPVLRFTVTVWDPPQGQPGGGG